MAGWLGVMLRRARLRGLVEGLVQRLRAEATELDAKDEAERFQDYGFAANPVDGQGLVLTVGGHTVVVRMDRLGERPQLAAYEVSVWHKDGHHVTLRSGGLVEVSCTRLEVNATEEIALNAPLVTAPSMKAGGVELVGHRHAVPGVGVTSGPFEP